ncbi:MAG: hypothetical protein HRT43_14830, partial [Campylobacteraceae bacterium]|nr:hypothetical protein [Campylobacteraceae bacterium]
MRILLRTVFISLSFIFFVGCATNNISSTTSTQQGLSLEVGLYPYVPRLEQFKKTIQKQWSEKHPNVKLI